MKEEGYMTATITETIIFKNTTAEELFNMFLSSELHSKIIGLSTAGLILSFVDVI